MPSPRLPRVAAVIAAIAAMLPAQNPPPGFTYETLVDGPLDSATAMAFLPDGRLLITERTTGNIRQFRDGALDAAPWATVPVSGGGPWAEQGLLGIAVDPAFLTNGFVYVFFTDALGLENRIGRLQEVGGVGTNLTVLSPPAAIDSQLYHNGGAMTFGFDGTLFVATGDGLFAQAAGDPLSWLGKILRFDVPNLTVPAGNPFPGNPVFSLGHRNTFGLAIHPISGRLYQTENGEALMDELNVIDAGNDYGWPTHEGTEIPPSPQFADPLAVYQPTIAPTGMSFYQGEHYPPQYRNAWFFTEYNQGRVRVVDLDATGNTVVGQSVFDQLTGAGYGVVSGPDGNLWVLTNDMGGFGADELGRYVHVNEAVPSAQALSVSNKSLGASMTICVHANDGDIYVPWLSFARAAAPAATPYGNLWVPPDAVLWAVPIVADARGYLCFSLPNLPAFLGSTIHTQAIVLSFTTGLALTNPSSVLLRG